jgi:hypothetical protein
MLCTCRQVDLQVRKAMCSAGSSLVLVPTTHVRCVGHVQKIYHPHQPSLSEHWQCSGASDSQYAQLKCAAQ